MAVWTKYLSADTKDISKRAYEKGLIVNDGKIFYTPETDYNSVRLGFVSLNLQEQVKAVEILKGCFR